jgi:hypothetical protein
MDNLLMTLLVGGLEGLAILVVLWPTMQSGRSLLRSWSIEQPTDGQSMQAKRYLRDRRLLYPALFLLSGWIGDLSGISDAGWSSWFVPVLSGLLIAEMIGALRRPAGVRVAPLARRVWRDLVPSWAMSLLGVLAVLGLALAATGAWAVMGGIFLCLCLVLGVVALAVRRPVEGDLAVDAALRTRSARVTVGIGIAWMASMLPLAAQRSGIVFDDAVGLVLFVVAVGGWIVVANPMRKLPFVRAAE